MYSIPIPTIQGLELIFNENLPRQPVTNIIISAISVDSNTTSTVALGIDELVQITSNPINISNVAEFIASSITEKLSSLTCIFNSRIGYESPLITVMKKLLLDKERIKLAFEASLQSADELTKTIYKDFAYTMMLGNDEQLSDYKKAINRMLLLFFQTVSNLGYSICIIIEGTDNLIDEEFLKELIKIGNLYFIFINTQIYLPEKYNISVNLNIFSNYIYNNFCTLAKIEQPEESSYRWRVDSFAEIFEMPEYPIINKINNTNILSHIVDLAALLGEYFTIDILWKIIEKNESTLCAYKELEHILMQLVSYSVLQKNGEYYKFTNNIFKDRISSNINKTVKQQCYINILKYIIEPVARELPKKRENFQLEEVVQIIDLWNSIRASKEFPKMEDEEIYLCILSNYLLGKRLLLVSDGKYIDEAKILFEVYLENISNSGINRDKLELLGKIYITYIQRESLDLKQGSTKISELYKAYWDKLWLLLPQLEKVDQIEISSSYLLAYALQAFSSMQYEHVFRCAEFIFSYIQLDSRLLSINDDLSLDLGMYTCLELNRSTQFNESLNIPGLTKEKNHASENIIKILVILIVTCYFQRKNGKAVFYAMLAKKYCSDYYDSYLEVETLYCTMLKYLLELMCQKQIYGELGKQLNIETLTKMMDRSLAPLKEAWALGKFPKLARSLFLACIGGLINPYSEITEELIKQGIRNFSEGETLEAALSAGNGDALRTALTGTQTPKSEWVIKATANLPTAAYLVKVFAEFRQMLSSTYTALNTFREKIIQVGLDTAPELDTNSKAFVHYLSLRSSLAFEIHPSELALEAWRLQESCKHLFGYFLGIHAQFLLAVYYLKTKNLAQYEFVVRLMKVLEFYQIKNPNNYRHMYNFLHALESINMYYEGKLEINIVIQLLQSALVFAKENSFFLDAILIYQELLKLYPMNLLRLNEYFHIDIEAIEFVKQHELYGIEQSLMQAFELKVKFSALLVDLAEYVKEEQYQNAQEIIIHIMKTAYVLMPKSMLQVFFELALIYATNFNALLATEIYQNHYQLMSYKILNQYQEFLSTIRMIDNYLITFTNKCLTLIVNNKINKDWVADELCKLGKFLFQKAIDCNELRLSIYVYNFIETQLVIFNCNQEISTKWARMNVEVARIYDLLSTVSATASSSTQAQASIITAPSAFFTNNSSAVGQPRPAALPPSEPKAQRVKLTRQG